MSSPPQPGQHQQAAAGSPVSATRSPVPIELDGSGAPAAAAASPKSPRGLLHSAGVFEGSMQSLQLQASPRDLLALAPGSPGPMLERLSAHALSPLSAPLGAPATAWPTGMGGALFRELPSFVTVRSPEFWREDVEVRRHRRQSSRTHSRKLRQAMSASKIEKLVQMESEWTDAFGTSLPLHVTLYILSFLKPKELVAASQVCKAWKPLAQYPTLWAGFCFTLGLEIPEQTDPTANPYTSIYRSFRKISSKGFQSVREELVLTMFDSPARARESCIFCGWAYKRGEDLLKRWKRRWFCVWNNHLCYFKQREDSRPCGMVPLTSNVQVRRLKATWLKIGSSMGFLPTLKLRDGRVTDTARSDCFLSTDTAEECDLWQAVLTMNASLMVDIESSESKPRPPRYPLFGVPPELLMERQKAVDPSAPIPLIVQRLLNRLHTPSALREEGLFRVPGDSAMISALRTHFEQGHEVDLTSVETHTIAALVKMFFRELPQPLIPPSINSQINKLLAGTQFAMGEPVPFAVMSQIRVLLGSVAPINIELLKALTDLLAEVVQHSNENKMTINNLFIVLIPAIKCAPSLLALALSPKDSLFF
eukprot:m51a1_g13117 hypothetical protein (592) ;mRNA; r:475-2769